MPPFSGKQKKKQLQEKRLQKKERQKRGDSSSSDRGVECAKPRRAYNHQSGEESGDDKCVPDQVHQQGEFKYGADRLGIRSVFLKESAEEIAARKRVSYERLRERNFVGNDGIPFGKWFKMPGITRASVIPFSVEIPTRGWRPCDVVSSQKVKGDSDGAADGSSTSSEGNALERTEDDDNDTHIPSDAAEVEARELQRFKEYMRIVDNFPLPSLMDQMQVSSYERNLDVWRQLWRTVEQSDVVIIVTDARYPIVHLPLSLLHYIVRASGKACVVVLNKADLVPRHVLDRWMKFLEAYFQATGIVAKSEEEAKEKGVVCNIPLVPFTSLPADETAIAEESSCNTTKRRKKKMRRNKLYEQLRSGKLQVGDINSSTGSSDEEEVEEELEGLKEHNGVGGAPNSLLPASITKKMDSKWADDAYAETDNFKGKQKAEHGLRQGKRDHKELRIVSDMITSLLRLCRDIGISRQKFRCNAEAGFTGNCNAASLGDTDGERRETTAEESYVHIGFVGSPNVGKSSLLNCIRGTKVVSVSSTAGHTKHLQTIPIPFERVVLIDSPGLTFPVFGVPRPLQAVFGTHQIAQTRDPQSGVAFLATHLQLERIYGLQKIDDYSDEDNFHDVQCGSNENHNNKGGKRNTALSTAWSPFEICESYARKKGYFVKRGKGSLDIHRGAIELLQEAYDGRVVLFLAPPECSWLESAAFRDVQPYLILRAAAA
ncbi:putative 50S ribosome binding GTPase [Trypanosoma vivax]|uniref:Guanine nucleotide-binding protein-like 1 n=1 Tax=Trypanosoma vivax (strain Y486) TaxID=1055687 RepID=G0TXJ7_TRYVY|nr:putative GTP-binding protein [Trypanosoma vivax]KAH8612514.1 putative 50S ribosome binding GTPase [Trypanosoma vivax]CCC48687.1 putative GTP-binding protein [Trypanosoma vivax Y486]